MRVFVLLVMSVMTPFVCGQEPDEDLPRSGLSATFSDSHGNRCERIDADISAVWGAGVPDPRIGLGNFIAKWSGKVLVRGSGEYQFSAFVAGRVTLALDGAAVLNGTADRPQWIKSKAIKLSAGFRTLDVTYEKTNEHAQVAVYWSGPGFGLEPLNSSHLFHEAPSDSDASFQRGRQLVRTLRCTNCHRIPTASSPMSAPALATMGDSLRASWIVARLTSDSEEAPELRQMPHLAMTTDEARAIAAYLTRQGTAIEPAFKSLNVIVPRSTNELIDQKKKQATGKSAVSSAAKKKATKEKAKHRPSVQGGHRLFVSLGCLACHSANNEGSSNLFGGGDLSRVGDKWLPGFFARWLKDPSQVNAHHRMPQFDLSADEISDLEMFLESRVSPETRQRPIQFGTDRDQLMAEGKRLVAAFRCDACHELENTPANASQPQTLTSFTSATDWNDGCLAAPSHAAMRIHRPWYRLPQSDVNDITGYLQQMLAVKQPARNVAQGEQLLESNNCLACHPRGLGRGINDVAGPIAVRYADVFEHVATLVPPSLNSIGDKLHQTALQSAITRRSTALRTWLNVRMPKFPLSDEQARALTSHFVDSDRMPEQTQPDHPRLDEQQLRTVGARLVTSDGFGCTSCHAVNDISHGSSPVNARGPNLGMLGQRVRPEWFYRWVANPLRVVPRVEMPAITTAVPGVLDHDLGRQVHAVWDVLNMEGFRPPLPNPVRTVRRSGTPEQNQRAVLLTDVIKSDSRQWIKPMVVGLPNRHNILFDLEHFRLAGWWIGDTARQRTLGKSWYWEVGGENLLPESDDECDIVLITQASTNEDSRSPEYTGQFRTELDAWEHFENGGLKTRHRLRFVLGRALDAQSAVVNVEQQFRSISNAADGRTGLRRTLRVSHLPDGSQISIRLFPPNPPQANVTIGSDRMSLLFAGRSAMRVQILPSSTAGQLTLGGTYVGRPSANHDFQVDIEYSTTLPVDTFPVLPNSVLPKTPPVVLDSVPGFIATQLDLPLEIMPTGFAWEPDGSMIVTSLRGNVWRARDVDHDGLADTAEVIADELAAPFGAYATGDYVDVINKYGLVRLYDLDRDGFSERAETVASGWGHTADYHDWALGLPRTKTGSYLVTLSCQQDDRSDAAAYLRGKILELNPRQPDRENPQPFSVELFSGGHRFPIGIAMNHAGDAFVTDNQGNYNPFNELNHLRRGARYGFINANEKSPGFSPPLTPPAIDIPHPWTRSVNGICFLETQPPNSPSAFGPFEGHLIGCEYDTRRLVRMSLEKVGETYQGAVYPFSLDPLDSGASLLGPISCGVSPQGELFVGNIRDSGWGAGQNIGNIVKLKFDPSRLPPGISQVQATGDGFRINFTQPMPTELARAVNNYSISSFTRTSTPEYGGDDLQRSEEKVLDLQLADDNRSVTLRLNPLKPGFVYEFQLDGLASRSHQFFPAEAYYTVRVRP